MYLLYWGILSKSMIKLTFPSYSWLKSGRNAIKVVINAPRTCFHCNFGARRLIISRFPSRVILFLSGFLNDICKTQKQTGREKCGSNVLINIAVKLIFFTAGNFNEHKLVRYNRRILVQQAIKSL